MKSTANMIPSPSTANLWVPRPGAVQLVDFIAGGFVSPGFISGRLVVGDLEYGTIASARNAGKDEPYCYDLAAGAFLAVGGILGANTPTSPPASGAWTPPILAQVGSRIIVTHPGFAGGAVKFGWFDISGFSEVTSGTLTSGNAVVTGNPSVLGVQPGMTVAGANVPAGATVLSTTQFVLDVQGVTHGNLIIDNLPTTAGIAIGQMVGGLGIPIGATVAGVGAGSVTLSAPATGSSIMSVTFSGGTITLSAPATGSGASTLTITGGTKAAPLWGAGDTDINNLLSVPVGVAQMGGRAWFALGLNGIRISDSGFACRVSDNLVVQALTTNDGLAVTAVAAMQLSAPLTGGIVQAIIAFEGATKMQQITGDMAIPSTSTPIADGGASTLAMNALPAATGTLAPLSITASELGLGFVSPEGLRFVKFDGSVSPPVGEGGKGVVQPFVFSAQPTRICAAANSGVMRITTQNATGTTEPQEEYWYDLRRGVWSGPHTSPASLIQPWRSSFLMSFIGTTAALWQSDAKPSTISVYVENNAQLQWAWLTSLLPDSGDGSMACFQEMTLACELAAATTASLTAVDDFNVVLDTTTVVADGTETIWDQFDWDQALWDSQGSTFRQRSVDWSVPLVWRQGSISATGQSAFNVKIGNLYMLHQKLGYKRQEAA